MRELHVLGVNYTIHRVTMNLVRIQTLWADINFKGTGLPGTKSADLYIRETFCRPHVTFIPAGVKATERKATLQLSVKLIGSDRCQTATTEKRTWAIAP